jgi:hypothetical protein
MIKKKNNTIFSCFIGLAIAIVWFAFSIFVTLEHAGATDTMPIDQPVPLWLKIGFAIALFPTNFLINMNQSPTGLSDHAAGEYFLSLMIFNSLFLGFLIVFLCRLTFKFLVTGKSE